MVTQISLLMEAECEMMLSKCGGLVAAAHQHNSFPDAAVLMQRSCERDLPLQCSKFESLNPLSSLAYFSGFVSSQLIPGDLHI